MDYSRSSGGASAGKSRGDSTKEQHDAGGLRTCNGCGTACYREDQFCPNCGLELASCGECGASVEHPIARFCTICGAKFSRLVPPPAIFLLLFSLILGGLSFPIDRLQAQGPNPIVVTTNVVPPYDPDLSVWERNPNRLLVTLRNTDPTATYLVRLGGFIESDDGGVRIEIKNSFPATPITLPPGATKTINARGTGLLDPNAVTVTGADRDEIARTRRLPEGNYRACLQALDNNTLAPLSIGAPTGCATFNIQEGDVPRPFFPDCEGTVAATPIQTVNIQWTRPVVAAGGILQYELVLVPVEEGKSAEESILAATTPIFFQKKQIATNYYQYGPLDPKLEEGSTYAWRVRATEVTGAVSFPNDGWSEVCSFTYGSADETTDLGDCDAPALNSTFPTTPTATANNLVPIFPYRNVPFMVRYSPLCPTMKTFTSDLQVKDSTGANVETWNRDFTYDATLYDEVAEKAGGTPAEEDVVNEKNTERHTPFFIARPPVAGSRSLPPGKPLTWNAQVTMTNEAGSTWTRRLGGKVQVGMGTPILSGPPADARTPLPISFSFQTSARTPANKIVPADDAVYKAEELRGYGIDSIGVVREVWMLEVSPTPFTGRDTILFRKTGKLGAKIPLTSTVDASTTTTATGTATNAILNRIYKTITVPSTGFNPTGGDYYWRVKWLVDNDTTRVRDPQVIADTAAYAWSEVRHFVVDTTADTVVSGIDSNECIRIKPVLPLNGGDWKEDLRPQFAVSIEPDIDITKVTGVQLDVWRLDDAAEQQDPKSVLQWKPDLSWNSSGPSALKARPAVPAPAGGTAPPRIYDLDLVNLPTSAKEWIAGRDSNYAWQVTLRYKWNGKTIRTDSVACDRDSALSALGTFRIHPLLPTIPDSICVLMAPHMPEHNEKITDSIPVFSVKATPPIDTTAINWVTLKVWKMRSKTESPAKVVQRTPVFSQALRLNGVAGNKIRNTYKAGDLASVLRIRDVNDTTDRNRPAYNFHPKIDSSYLWQVEIIPLAGRRLRVDSVECVGAPDTLRSAYGVFRYDTTRADTVRACPDSCSSPTPANKTLRAFDFSVGDSVKIGRFAMTLTSLDDPSPSGLSGEGEIPVRWLKMSVEVEFSGLQVNTLGQVISGLVRAKQSPTVTLPAQTMNSAGATPWTQEGVLAGYGAATAAARMANSLIGGGSVSMPIGFEASLGNEAGEPAPGGGMAIGITDMTFTPEGANLTALAKMPLPFMGKERGLGFGVRNLCFTPKSFTSGVEKNVFLAADAGFRDGDTWGFKVLAPTIESGVTTDSGTYITWDCHGVSAFRVAAAVEFPRSMMLPITATGEIEQDSTKLVTATASFLWRRPDPVRADSIKKAKEATVSSTTTLRRNSGADTTKSKMTKNGFHVLASGKITRFAPTNTPDLQVEVANVTFDWSDFENPVGMVFPTNYTGDMTNLWRGFYLRGAYVRLPNAMTNRDSATKPLAIEAEYLMVDRSGLSFRARADNLLPIDKGRSSGWALGIEKTTLEVVNNIPRELSMAGQVRVPIFKNANNEMRDSLGRTLSGTRDTGIYRNTTGIGYDATLQYVRQLRPDSGTVASSRSGADTSKYVSLPKFSLTLNTRDNLMMPMWSAKASLGGNVTVSIEKRWIPPSTSSTSTTRKVPRLGWVAGLKLSAALNFGGGSTNVSSSTSGTTTSTTTTPENSATKPPAMNFAGIGVQGFQVESVKPYLISFGTWTIGGVQVSSGSTTSDPSSSTTTPSSATTTPAPTTGDKPQPAMEGFPLSISNITPASSTNDAGESTMGLTFDINLHLMPTETAGFSSATTLGLFGKMGSDTTQGQQFEFSHFELKKIAVDAMFGPVVRLKGVVQFYRNDKVYGSGFYGAVDATILEKINAQLIAQFGTVKVGPDTNNMRDHRYGLVDFAAKFTPGIPLGTTGVSFYGAGGGVWFGMGRTGNGPAMPLQSSNDVSNFKIGQSLSGYIYKPDTATLFGVRIMATLGASDANAFNADIALEVEVTPSFGIGRVTLQGKGYGLSTKFPDRSDSRLNATVDITYRPPSKEFHGLFAMSLIQEPAISVNGQVVMHFDPKSWYVKFGEPSNRISAKIGFLAEVSAYFMFGNDLPPPPAPPGSITSKLGPVAADRDFAVTKGEGIVLGAQASFDTGEKTFLIFYGKVKALLGFDASILKYSEDLECGGVRPVGMNSWYANIQMYGELDAQIGIKAKLGFATVKAEIFNAQAWALLKAGGPNPTWAAGKIAGKYNVLGGLVKGDFTFEFDVGKKCTPGSGVLGNIKLITDVAPAQGDDEVDPSVSPQATFGMAINKEFSTTLAGQKGKFRLLLDRFLVQRKSGRGWTTLRSSTSLDNAKTTATAYPREMLNAQTDHRLVVTVRMQKKNWHGGWSDFWVEGNRVVEEKQIIFKSGDLPETIPAGNVAYTWPIQGQRFFMKSEGTRWGNHTGRIVLKQGQAYLFQKNPKATSLATWVEVRSNDGADVRTYTASYSSGNREVTFRIPGNLHNGKIYTVNLIRKEVFPAKDSKTEEEDKVIYGAMGDDAYRKAYNETYSKEYSTLYAKYFAEYSRTYGRSWYGSSIARRVARSRASQEARTRAVAAGNAAKSAASGATATTTDRTLTGTKSSGRVDQKVISNYGFGTSAYSTYSSKMANTYVESDTRYTYTTSIWVRHRSEGFDAFDVRGFGYSRDGKSYKVAPRYRANSTDNSRSWHRDMIENQLKAKKRDFESWFPNLKARWMCWDSHDWACRKWYWNKRHAYVAETWNVAPLMTESNIKYNQLGTTYNQKRIQVVQTQGENARIDYDHMKRVEGKWWFKATKTTTKVVSVVVTKVVEVFVKVWYEVKYWVSKIWNWFKCKVLGIRSACGYYKTETRSKYEKRAKTVYERVNKTVTETLTIPTPRWIGQYGGSYTMQVEWNGGSKAYTFSR